MKTAVLPGGISLAYDDAGDVDAPAVIPILGITDNITDWPESMTLPLIAAGYRVIRYELRDSGHSSRCGGDIPLDVSDFPLAAREDRLPVAPYTLFNMVDDLQGLMDAVGLNSAHLVGYSYGGAVAQLAALRLGNRVNSLVCLQSTNYNPALSVRTPDVAAAMAEACREYASVDACVTAMTRLRMATNGSDVAMTYAEARTSASESVARAYYPAGTARMVLSRFATPSWHEQTSDIRCPALVLHGTDDPIFGPDHGEAVAQQIPDAGLRWLEGAGHNHPLSLQPKIVDEILRFLG